MAPTTSKETNEATLLPLVQRGDERAMLELYRQNVRYLTGVCSRYVGDEDETKDVMQEAFLKIFSAVGSFKYRGEGSLRGWMARIVVNEALKFLQHRRRLNFVGLDPEETDVPDETPDTADVPAKELHRMIRELPDGYRTIFNLFVVEEKSHKEIAAMLHIKENTSASQLHRAKALLAEKIRHYKTHHSTPL